MQLTTRQILGIVLILLVAGFSFYAWQAFFEAQSLANNQELAKIFGWFSLAVIFFLVGMVVWGERALRLLGALAVFLPSLFFLYTGYHIGIVFFSALLAFVGIYSVQQEINARLRFHFTRSLSGGQFVFIMALALVLASGYFSTIEQATWEELVPRFHLGEGSTAIIFRVAARINPSLYKLTENNVTVDEFLESLQEKDSQAVDTGLGDTESAAKNTQQKIVSIPLLTEYLEESGLETQTVSEENLSRELYLTAGREQIALLVERPVAGDEKIADVFSLAMQRRIITSFSGFSQWSISHPRLFLFFWPCSFF
jgi:hypothetical protein